MLPVVILTYFLLSLPLKSEANTIELTEEEKAWIKENPTIKVQNESDFYPFNFNEGRPSGFSIDYMNLLAEKTGLSIQYLENMSWSDTMEGIQNGKLDVIVNIINTPERQSKMMFTQSYFKTQSAIFVKKGKDLYPDLQSLRGKTVAIPAGFADQTTLTKYYPDIKQLAVGSSLQAVRAVITGNADATINESAHFSYLIDQMNVESIRQSALLQEEHFSQSFSLAVRNDLPILKSILNKAIQAVDHEELRVIHSRWILMRPIKNWAYVNLSEDEVRWLNKHKSWRVGIDSSVEPFEFRDKNGKHAGLSAEYLTYIANALNVELKYQPNLNWQQVISKAKSKDIDILPLASRTPKREEYLAFTKPYIKYPVAIITRKGTNTIESINDLSDKKVAFVADYPVTELSLSENPEIKPIIKNSLLEVLQAVSSGEAEAFIMDVAIATYKIREYNFVDLEVSAYANFSSPGFSIAIRKDWQPLVSILDKLLDSISQEQHASFANRWVTYNQIKAKDKNNLNPNQKWVFYTFVAIGLAMIVSFLIWWKSKYSHLAKQNSTKFHYDSKRTNQVVVLVNAILVLFLTVMTWLSISKLEQQHKNKNQQALETTLRSTNSSLESWVTSQRQLVKYIASDKNTQKYANRIISDFRAGRSVRNSENLSSLRQIFYDAKSQINHLGFFIITPEGINVASQRDSNLGKENLIFRQRFGLFQRVLSGETVWIPPIRSDVDELGILVSDELRSKATMFIATPLYNSENQIEGVLTYRLAPKVELGRILNIGQLGDSGETYIFDIKGKMLSESKFNNQLVTIGLLEKGQESTLSLVIKDPGVNLIKETSIVLEPEQWPLTEMAGQATRKLDGFDVKGYRDYRGVYVIGAWLWNENLGIGMTTEMDLNESLSTFYSTRSLILIALIVTILLASGSTIVLFSIGNRVNQKLAEGKELLEQEVVLRTNEINKINLLQKSILDGSGYAIIAADVEGIITVFNPAAERLLGYESHEIIGIHTPALFHLEAEVVERAAELSEELGRTIEPGFEVFVVKSREGLPNINNWTYVHRIGEHIPVKLSVTCLKNQDGQIFGYLGIAYDISSQLAHEAALAKAKDEAERAAKAKSEFLANMSHEVRTPMNGLIGTLQLLKQEELTNNSKTILEKALFSSDLLITIINDILDLSKLETGKLSIESRTFNLHELVDQLGSEFKVAAKNKGISFEFQCSVAHQYWKGDTIRIRQVMLNLISNAIKFTEEGGVMVYIYDNPHDESALIFKVTDSGIGMDDETLSRIFDRFEQADQSTTRKYGGTGLGLAISKSLIDLMQGKVDVESSVNKGTTFTVTLPLSRADATSLQERSEVEPPDLQHSKILVAEDNQVNKFVVKGLLDLTRAELHFAANGAEAVELVREEDFDLILMDIQMPVMDGVEACKRIKKFGNKTPIVALTANAFEEDKQRYMEIGFDGYLAKPISKNELFFKLKRFLDR